MLFAGVRGTSVKILNRVERTDSYLDKLIDSELRSSEFNDFDKALLMEIVHGVLRWQSKLDWVLNGFFHGNFSKAEVTVRNTLRAALYQILFLDKVPDHAAVNEAVEFMKRVRGEKAAGLVNGVLRNIIRNKEGIHYPDVQNDAALYLSTMFSYPLWMLRRWMNRFGFYETEKLLEAQNQKPGLTLRINTMKTSIEDFMKMFELHNISYERSSYLPMFLRTTNLSNISQTEIFRRGFFTVQDESAGIASTLLDVKPGERVIDLCSAPGGKTTFFGETMKNQGKIIAVDKYQTRLNLVKTGCERLGITNVEYVAADGGDFESEPADKVIVDAPCSGLGVLAKKPDIKIKREMRDIVDVVKSQERLIENASKLLKSGGTMVYSTCTIEPEENFNLVKKFLENHPEFSIDPASKYVNEKLVHPDGYVETYPHRHGIDGSFAIRLIKA
ncbi:MAG: 16S rRNA (cytosine(967)-C(5))-methyltransferase RsmB [Ignavibacteriales bacterium]|nr:16S rRNA (cytosine(967)-C(5))-methyltransferase RsmB [Ignavibacteriales bacterium]